MVIFAMSHDSNFVMNVPVKQPLFNYESLNQAFISFRDETEVPLINVPHSRLQDKEKVSTLFNWIGIPASKCHKGELNFEYKDKNNLVNVL